MPERVAVTSSGQVFVIVRDFAVDPGCRGSEERQRIGIFKGCGRRQFVLDKKLNVLDFGSQAADTSLKVTMNGVAAHRASSLAAVWEATDNAVASGHS
jgi:hypothetical protein